MATLTHIQDNNSRIVEMKLLPRLKFNIILQLLPNKYQLSHKKMSGPSHERLQTSYNMVAMVLINKPVIVLASLSCGIATSV